MRIAIIAAMDKELSLLLELIPAYKVSETEGQKMYHGKIGDHDVCLSKCGIGKVNSALNTYRVIHSFKPELVINSGVAGGADASLPIGTVLVADGAFYHDVWCGPGTIPGQADGCPFMFLPYENGMRIVESMKPVHPALMTGAIASGDKFISTAEQIAAIKEIYPDAKACDMESASVAQTCHECNIPFMVVRVVSDTPGSGDNIEQYQNFWTEAPQKTFKLLEELLTRF